MNERSLPIKFIVILLSFAAFFSMLIFLIVFKVENKIVSLINYYDFNVIVKIKSFEFALEPYDTMEVMINTKNPIDVEVYNLSKELVDVIKVENVSRSSQLALVKLSPNNIYCDFSSELVTENDKLVLKNKRIINKDPHKYSIINIDELNYNYIYPGKVLTKSNSGENSNIRYVLPLRCDYTNEESKIISSIQVFQSYNAEEQRKYYQEVKHRISASESLEDINSAVPDSPSKYYISDDEYVLMFE